MPAPPDPDAEGEEDNSRIEKKDEHVSKKGFLIIIVFSHLILLALICL
jgi:hypothetical protein